MRKIFTQVIFIIIATVSIVAVWSKILPNPTQSNIFQGVGFSAIFIIFGVLFVWRPKKKPKSPDEASNMLRNHDFRWSDTSAQSILKNPKTIRSSILEKNDVVFEFFELESASDARLLYAQLHKSITDENYSINFEETGQIGDGLRYILETSEACYAVACQEAFVVYARANSNHTRVVRKILKSMNY